MKVKMTTGLIIQRFENKHGDKYDYSKVNYTNMKTKVEIICPAHGSFMQTPGNHIQGKGCSQCAAEKRGRKAPVVTKPVDEPKSRHPRGKPVRVEGTVYQSISEAARNLGVIREIVCYRLYSKRFTEYDYVNEADNPWRG